MTIPAPSENPAPPASADETQRQLDRSLLHGVAWTGGIKWVTQILSWSATLVIARILTPADYGLVGMAMLYLGFVQLVNEFGLGAAIIRERDLTEDQISVLAGLSILLGLGLWAASAALAIPVAAFFRETAVQWIITILGVTFVTTGVRVVPRSLMTRDLQFKRVAATDATEALSATVVTLVLAVAGARYWSLVWGSIVGSTAGTLLALWWRGHRVRWPHDLAGLRHAITFGSHVVVSRISWYLYSNADFTIVGRVLGKVALGAYNFGWTLASIPVSRISVMVGQVTPAIFAAVQNDQAALRRYLLRLSEGLAFVTFPFAVGVALVADDFVFAALGDKWRGAIVPLRLLALYASIRSVSTILPQILVYVGRSRDQMRFSLLALCVMPPLFYIGAREWGTTGVAWAWIVGYPIIMIPVLLVAFEITGLTWLGYLGSLLPATTGCLGMALVVLSLRMTMPASWSPLARLAVESSAGAAVYAGLMYGLYGKRLRSAVRMVRELRK